MGLSITSSPAPAAVSGASGLASKNSGEVVAGDFFALLSSELGNFGLPSQIINTDPLASDSAKSDENSLMLESSAITTPQIDPALIAALNAAAAAKAPPEPATMSVSAENGLLGGEIGTGSTQPNMGQTLGGRAELKSGKTPDLSFSLTDQSSNLAKVQLPSPNQITSPEPKTLNFDSTKDFSPLQNKPQNSSSLTSPAVAILNATNNESFSPFQSNSDMKLMNDTPPAISSLSTNVSVLKSTEIVQSELKANLQDKVWPQQFGEKIVWMAKSDVQSAQININPPELGPIQITLNLSGDQAKISFGSPHAEVRQSIENSLPQLKEMLSSSGINLGQANVGANLQQQQREAMFQNTNGRQNPDENAILPAGEVALAKLASSLTQGGRGLVDLFA